MKNKLIDLNNHLFAQIERLSDEDITNEELQKEMQRTRAITAVSREIVANGTLALQVQKAVGDKLVKNVPEMLEHNK